MSSDQRFPSERSAIRSNVPAYDSDDPGDAVHERDGSL